MKLSTFAAICFAATFVPITLAAGACEVAPHMAEAEPKANLVNVRWWNGIYQQEFKTEAVTYGENRIWFTDVDGYTYVLSGPTLTWKKP